MVSLKAARVNCNLRQSEVAKTIGCSVATLSYWENGKTDIPAVALMDLCRLYGISMNDVILPSSKLKEDAK